MASILPQAFTRKYQKIKGLTWDETRTRLTQAIAKRRDLLTYKMGGQFEARPGTQVGVHGKFFFQSNELPLITEKLRHELPATAAQILSYADAICAHRFDLLGYRELQYGEKIDWQLDIVNNKRAPDLPWFKVPYLDFDLVGDSKVTWELNRHQHLPVLARAFHLSGDQKYLSQLVSQWYDWRKSNPYPIGISWASSLEVAFRAVSWLWVRELLQDCESIEQEFRRDLEVQLALAGRHIELYLSTYFAPNTHLLGEGLALFFIGTLVPALPHADRWRTTGWKILLKELDRQFSSDGMHFEHSTYYHVYAVDFYLHARMLAVANGVPLPSGFDARLKQMLSALNAVSLGGIPISWGDDDGGRLFDPRRNKREHMLDPLCIGAVLFSQGDFKRAAQRLTEECLWLLGPSAAEKFGSIQGGGVTKTDSLTATGLYTITPKHGEQLVIHAAALAHGSGGHSHADALSVQLVREGKALLTDAGTGYYAGPGGTRDALRGTRAHNSASVDGLDQARPSSLFGWQSRFHTEVEHWIEGESFCLFSGSHDGYTRLNQPVTHKRLVFSPQLGPWIILDRLLGEGTHDLEINWLFPKTLGLKRSTDFNFAGDSDFRLVTTSNAAWISSLVDRSYSPIYGQIESATGVRISKRAHLPQSHACVLSTNAKTCGILELLNPDQETGVVGYAYRTSEQAHYFFYKQLPGTKWKCAAWEGDAVFAYACFSARKGNCLQVVICKGSFLNFNSALLTLENAVERWEAYDQDGAHKIASPLPVGVLVSPESFLFPIDSPQEPMKESISEGSGR